VRGARGLEPKNRNGKGNAVNIDFEGIEQIIASCQSEQILQETLERLRNLSEENTKEEAIIRLLIDLPVSG